MRIAILLLLAAPAFGQQIGPCVKDPLGSIQLKCFGLPQGASITLDGQLDPVELIYHVGSRREDDGLVLLPNKDLTPGVVATTDTKFVCAKKWGKDARAVTAAMKAQVYAEYHVKPKQGVCAPIAHRNKAGKLVKSPGCEIDHLISRENGGADKVENLWAQPYLTPDQPGAYAKDKLENWLHREVCANHISLAQAQVELQTDWYASYIRHGLAPKKP